MIGFLDRDRVLVSRCGRNDEHEINPPAIGVVVRRRIADNGAWVALAQRGRDEIHPFPVGDPRETHVLAYPEHCEVAP